VSGLALKMVYYPSHHPIANAIITIAIATITIIVALVIAYLIYIRGKQDDYSLKVKKNLRELNNIITRFSELEAIRYRPTWDIHESSYRNELIIQTESWQSSPENALKDVSEKFKEEFQKAQQLDAKNGFRGPARRAIYNKSIMELYQLTFSIYREFPAPPGDYRPIDSNGIPYFNCFVDDGFPSNKGRFLSWVDKYIRFYKSAKDLYRREIRTLLRTLQHIQEQEESVRRNQIASIRGAEMPSDFKQFVEQSLKESNEYRTRELNYYVEFFNSFDIIWLNVAECVDNIRNFERYQFSNWKYFIIIFSILLIVFGLVLPILTMFGIPFPTDNYIQTLKISIFVFAILTFLTFLLLLLEVIGGKS
jgi:hypothetical protein